VGANPILKKKQPARGGLEGDLLEEGGSEDAGHRERHDYLNPTCTQPDLLQRLS
jgi:hypothetical protein